MRIHIAVYEPSPDHGGVGGFEWRPKLDDAVKAFRHFRSSTGTALLFTDVTVPPEVERQAEVDKDYITDWVDYVVWTGGISVMTDTFGPAAKTFARE